MIEEIIGREDEISQLQKVYESQRPEFVAVYGRRRIGKTFLIDKLFAEKYDFYITGIYEGSKNQQLANFQHQLEHYSGCKCRRSKDWFEAFFALQDYLTHKLGQKRIIVFIDELPWLDTHRSGFIKAFELFWNEWASKHNEMMLIVCGSATTWMTGKLIGNKGGLHNRVTSSIYLRSFNLKETRKFFSSRGFRLSNQQVADAYMVFGGTPFYLNMLQKSESIAQNIDRLFFGTDAPLRREYEFLFKSLFKESMLYKKVVETLSQKAKGMTRQELLNEINNSDSGVLSTVLTDLCNCDFIRKYSAFGKKERDMMYQLTDLYSLFYLRFVKGYNGMDENYWSHRQMNISSWQGYAFEQLCLHHISEIKRHLGITGVLNHVCSMSWRKFTDGEGLEHDGGQIDLILDRADNTINICEMKYCNKQFAISKEYLEQMNNRCESFRLLTNSKKTLNLTMITSNGLEHNERWNAIQNEIVLDDLF